MLEEISDGDGCYDGSLLDGQEFEPIPMGGTILVPIPAGTSGETNLVFTHIPLN